MKQKTSTKTNSFQYLFTACLLIIFSFATPTFATTYYVDSNAGNDLNSGLSAGSPWQTLTKVNSYLFSPNDSVLFIRNSVWRGQLIPKSGSITGYITYSDYGTGAKPLLLGSVNKSTTSDWINEGGNIWRSAVTFTKDIGNLIFNNATAFGFKKWTNSALSQQGDFCFDKTSYVLRIYSTANPANIYSEIECAVRQHIIDQNAKSYISYSNLSLKYGGAHGIGGGNTHHIIVSDCDISYMGGGDIDGINNTRYGNGIEFWANAHDNIVERCKIWEIYDSGVTNQNHGNSAQQYNITYRNNLIWNCSMASFEYFNRPSSSSTHGIFFENNTCVNSGYGWGGLQRPDPRGGGVLCWSTEAPTDSIVIRNNIFYNARRTLVFIDTSSIPLNGIILNNNCYKQFHDSTYIELYPTKFDSLSFLSYQTTLNNDQNSFIANPVFVDLSNSDFHIMNNSPCVNTGLSINNSRDIDFEIRNINSIDIGADEYYPNTSVGGEPLYEMLFFIYPNPAIETLTIQFIGNNSKEQVQIFNSIGALIKEIEITQTLQINVADLPDGLYFIRLKNGQQQTQKFIKQ
ncbi:MAG: T9SS type A sorting domain-containing protein [Bacteroidetes bacterium]|nr:T9SS type A sorting domain-containing protein [Bacteroidota bacterium]